MAYNRENLLIRIIEIQNTVLFYKEKGLTQIAIYSRYIADRYHISYSCFNNYLAVPAKTELKELRARRQKKEQQQPKLF